MSKKPHELTEEAPLFGGASQCVDKPQIEHHSEPVRILAWESIPRYNVRYSRVFLWFCRVLSALDGSALLYLNTLF